jgi:16S rRNA (uracil1498-N3)-methyltransferase
MYLADPTGVTPDSAAKPDLSSKTNVLGIIGPEGGFTSAERERLAELRTTSISLGNKRLRTETASVLLAWWLTWRL